LFESDVSTHLKYHLLPRVVAEKDMHDGSQEATEQGESVFITVQGADRDIWINDAYIVDGDHLAENGAAPPPPLPPLSTSPLSSTTRVAPLKRRIQPAINVTQQIWATLTF
jgi:hypothetical protein